MKTISTPLAVHLTLACTTLATLWKVVRQDGVTFGFTNCDQDLSFDDGMDSPSGPITYYASTGMTPTATETNSDLSTDNLEISAFLDSSAISEIDLEAGLYNYAQIYVYLVNYMDLTQGAMKIRSGTLGQVSVKNGLFTAEIRGLSFYFSTVLGTTFGPICRADLGDATCSPHGEVDLNALSQVGVVTSLTDNREFEGVASDASPIVPFNPGTANYFNGGVLTWLTGSNAGFLMEVETWDGTTFSLFESMPFEIVAGDTFKVEPGCNKSSDCQTKFSNIANMQAEPFIPGMDQILNYGVVTS